MADGMNVTLGVGVVVVTDSVVDSDLGSAPMHFQYVKLVDATPNGTTKVGATTRGLKVQPAAAAISDADRSGEITTGGQQPVVLYDSTTQVATPAASTAENELFALTLPVLSASAELAFEFDALHTGSGGTRTWKVKLGGTSILLPTASATTVPIFAMRGNLWANSSTSAQIAHAITGRGTDSLLAPINGTGSKDMTTPQVLSLTAQCASAADVMTLRRAKVTLLRP